MMDMQVLTELLWGRNGYAGANGATVGFCDGYKASGRQWPSKPQIKQWLVNDHHPCGRSSLDGSIPISTPPEGGRVDDANNSNNNNNGSNQYQDTRGSMKWLEGWPPNEIS